MGHNNDNKGGKQNQQWNNPNKEQNARPERQNPSQGGQRPQNPQQQARPQNNPQGGRPNQPNDKRDRH